MCCESCLWAEKTRFEFLRRYGKDEADNDLLTGVSHDLSHGELLKRFHLLSLEHLIRIRMFFLNARKITFLSWKGSLRTLKHMKCRPYADWCSIVSAHAAAFYVLIICSPSFSQLGAGIFMRLFDKKTHFCGLLSVIFPSCVVAHILTVCCLRGERCIENFAINSAHTA